MNKRARRVVIVLPVLVTLVVALAIGSLVALQNQRQNEQVDAAETVGQDYLSAVATFRGTVAKRIAASKKYDPAKFKGRLDEAVAEPPALPVVTGFGGRNSVAYREAIQVEESLLAPYSALSDTLKAAEVSVAFIEAAQKVLGLRVTDFVGFGLLRESGSLRSSLIPAFVTGLEKFDAVRVPRGQKKLAATVHDSVQYVIDEATVLANRIDARQGYSFTYSAQFNEALTAVRDYETVVEGDISEAINAALTAP